LVLELFPGVFGEAFADFVFDVGAIVGNAVGGGSAREFEKRFSVQPRYGWVSCRRR
jgi:hypothetical protein